MGFFTGIKIRKALLMHQKGDKQGAFEQYEAFYKEGLLFSSYMLPYSVLLLKRGKEGDVEKAKEVLVKAQKAPDLKDADRRQLLMNYAVCLYKMGELDKAIEIMERSHQKTPCGITYQTLGYLYIQKGDAEKALSYNLEALEYDEDDSIVLDNMGQLYYRLLDDKKKAREYFEKALEKKAAQIDTLYFLSRYDLEEGNKEAALEKLEVAREGSFSPLNYVTKAIIEQEIKALTGEDA